MNIINITKKAVEVSTCQPNHSIITLPLLLENHIDNELMQAIINIRKRTFNN